MVQFFGQRSFFGPSTRIVALGRNLTSSGSCLWAEKITVVLVPISEKYLLLT